MSSPRTLWSFNIIDANSDIIGSSEICIAFKDTSTAEFAVYAGISIFPKDLRNVMISMTDEANVEYEADMLVPVFSLEFVEYVHDDDTITNYEGSYLLTTEFEGKAELFSDLDSDLDSETELVSDDEPGLFYNSDDE